MPLRSGRTVVYRLDSTVRAPFGTALNIISYHAKDSTGSAFLDNTGRQSFAVYRFTTDTLESNEWQYQSTYYVTATSQSVEVMDENNLRFLKLKSPVRNGFSWMGNSFIDTRSANTPYQYLDGWNYMYANVNEPYFAGNVLLDSSITVLQRDETSPEGPFDPQFYYQLNYAKEVYAKGIGLVYKDFLHWTWQTTPPPSRYDDDSYGIKLTFIEVRHE